MTKPFGGTAFPPVDMAREGAWLVLTAALPGLRPEDFRVSLVGLRQIYIEGTVPYRHPVPREGLALQERAVGPFSRTIDLPLPVDAGGAEIRFQDGLLTVRLHLTLQRIPLRWGGSGVGQTG